jgi:beta-phosphoglucomutase-like phosphatase (HAD superfamily)
MSFLIGGALIDSESISMAVDLALLAENGIHLTETEMYSAVGLTLRTWWRGLSASTERPCRLI